jgi:hypothetical protein
LGKRPFLRGVFLAAMDADEAQIEASFSEAIRIAKGQKSVSLEKRAETTYAEYPVRKRAGQQDVTADYLSDGFLPTLLLVIDQAAFGNLGRFWGAKALELTNTGTHYKGHASEHRSLIKNGRRHRDKRSEI